MLSREKLADIVRDEAENEIRKGNINAYFYNYYYILPDGKMYPGDDYDVEVEEGKRPPNDIYALVDEWHPPDFEAFLFRINYLQDRFVPDIVFAYLRKAGFTIEQYGFLPPTPNLKYYIEYFIYAEVKRTPEYYLGINIYDIDSLAESLYIPQIVEQRLGGKPRKITTDELFNIESIVTREQPILAGHTYKEAYRILEDYFVFHKEEYKKEANKIVLAFAERFPSPYQVCYEWEARTFDKIDCLKIVLRSF